MAILRFLLPSWLIASAFAAVTTSGSGVSAIIGDAWYWIPPSAVGQIPHEVSRGAFGSPTPDQTAFAAVTLLNHEDGSYTSQSIDQDLERFSKSDDVWGKSFSEGTDLPSYPSCNSIRVQIDSHKYLTNYSI